MGWQQKLEVFIYFEIKYWIWYVYSKVVISLGNKIMLDISNDAGNNA
jgi:hypothetical protein